MKTVPTLLTILLLTAGLLADDQLREAQQLLKSQGFYFGEITGEPSDATRGAVRRFQMRSGLEPTGELNAETLSALREEAGTGTAGAPAETAAAAPDRGEDSAQTATNNRRPAAGTARQTPGRDMEFLEMNPPQPPAAAPGGDDALSAVFARSPYARAPRQVQTATLRKAQNRLRKAGLYRGPVDGIPGPELEAALRQFQYDARLPETGVLDTMTLNAMRMLPGQEQSPFGTTGRGPAIPKRR